jgi:anaerobic magnesium-protoporphyrin IX monomethyl ester cyclase
VNWVTMLGPKIEMRRRKGEENATIAMAAMGVTELGLAPSSTGAAKACGGGTEQLVDEAPAAVPMACGGGRQQLSDAEAERV